MDKETHSSDGFSFGDFLGIAFFTILIGGVFTATAYFPLRLYYTGQKVTGNVNSINCGEFYSSDGINSYTVCKMSLSNIHYNFNVNEADAKKLKIGETINVFYSNKLRKGVYLGNQKVNFWNIFVAFQTFAEASVFSFLVFMTLILTATFNIYSAVIKGIAKDISEEISKSSKPINKRIAFGKVYTTILTGCRFLPC